MPGVEEHRPQRYVCASSSWSGGLDRGLHRRVVNPPRQQAKRRQLLQGLVLLELVTQLVRDRVADRYVHTTGERGRAFVLSDCLENLIE